MKFGLTQPFECSYLEDETEQLLILMDEAASPRVSYSQLIQAGFRRSGDQIYRPHCPACQACHSLRVLVNEFLPSKSQKRVLKKNQPLRSVLSTTAKESYYPLYEKYISTRHKDGTMYPPTVAQFNSFVQCQWKPPVYVEAYQDEQLVAVAVTDEIEDGFGHVGFSALYTFFDPDYDRYSIGTWMILQQIAHAKCKGHDFLYLGYQIDNCQKMQYKRQFFPHERFIANKWERTDKNHFT